MKNLFIVFDGIDGCGKGTMIKKLHNFLFDNKKLRILTTREPTYGKYGLEIRKILKEEKDPYAGAEKCLELYTKDRKEHVENVIKPFLNFESGENINIILCDRYYHSTYVFQQAQGIAFGKIHELQKEFPRPDFTFILDVDPEIALERISKSRDSYEKFEKLEFMKKIRNYFLELKERLDENIIVVDASKSKEEVFGDILKVLKSQTDL